MNERFKIPRGKGLRGFVFLLILFFGFGVYSLLNAPVFWSVVNESGGFKAENIEGIASQYKERLLGRTELIDLYGTSLNVLRKDMIGDFQFIRDERGVIHQVGGAIQTDDFRNSMLRLQEKLAEQKIPLVYLLEPDRAEGMPMTLYGQRQPELVQAFAQAGIDVLDMGDVMRTDPEAPSREEFFFHTDGHFSSYAEFWTSRRLAEHLEQTYGVRFPNAGQVYNRENYSILTYDFLGNIARSVGKYYVGVDRFENYIPNFPTDLTLTDFSGAQLRNGDFQTVVMNGYEKAEDPTPYAYWVTNYAQYSNAFYEYQNHRNPDAPRVLLIMDSTFMRGMSFLTLACSKVTVADMRFANGFPYVEYALEQDRYDAVVVCGPDTRTKGFMRDTALPDIPQEPAQNTDGFFLETCNGAMYGDRESTIFIDHNQPAIELSGWAADWNTQQPLSALYIQVGDHILQCDYGAERMDLSGRFGKEALKNIGFSVAFPASYLKNNPSGVLRFVQIGVDGANSYAPIERRITYPPAVLTGYRAEPVEYRWDGPVLEATFRNISDAVWTEQSLIRAAIFSEGNDTGLRGYLQPEAAVAPGEDAVFRISVQGREELIFTRLEATMLQESICYFGERMPLQMIGSS